MKGKLFANPSSLVIKVDHFVQEGLVQGLPSQSTAQQLDVESPLLKCHLQLVGDDRLVLVEASLPSHLLLEHPGEKLRSLIWLRQ